MVGEGGAHRADASTVSLNGPYDYEAEVPANVRDLRPRRRSGWEWETDTDGALALAPEPALSLKEEAAFVSVPPMSWPEAPGLAARATLREQERARARRARRVGALLVVAAASLITFLLLGFGPGGTKLATLTGPAPAERLLPAGPPRPQIVAMRETLRIQLPIEQERVTAIGYHAAGTDALALEPVGTQANAGLLGRFKQRIFGESGSRLRYYLLDGGSGPRTGGLDVGARADTDVYAPVDGTVIAISDRILNGKRYGVRIDIQPSGNPGMVVAITNLRADPALAVGSTVVAAITKVGRVVDLSDVERAELARYTTDKGQHVHLEVHAAASLASP